MWVSIQYTFFVHFNTSIKNQGLIHEKATQFFVENTFIYAMFLRPIIGIKILCECIFACEFVPSPYV